MASDSRHLLNPLAPLNQPTPSAVDGVPEELERDLRACKHHAVAALYHGDSHTDCRWRSADTTSWRDAQGVSVEWLLFLPRAPAELLLPSQPAGSHGDCSSPLPALLVRHLAKALWDPRASSSLLLSSLTTRHRTLVSAPSSSPPSSRNPLSVFATSSTPTPTSSPS